MLKKIFKIILFIAVLCVAIFMFYNYRAFEVITGSMSPSIEVSDVVIVKVTKDNINVDDIIVFKEGQSIITHRVIEMNEEFIVTKGDANNAKDKSIKKEAIIGKVIKIIPKIGVVKKVLTTPPVYISIITTFFLFWFAFSKDKKRKNTKGKHYA